LETIGAKNELAQLAQLAQLCGQHREKVLGEVELLKKEKDFLLEIDTFWVQYAER